jgi:peptide/nickel transport system permease protein
MMLAAALADWIAPYEPDATDADAALQAPMSWHHWLGTDIYGRHLQSRIIYAACVHLAVVFGATALALVIGSSIGVAAGLYRGIVDLVIMRCVDSIMAFPAFILAMAITAALGNSVGNVLIAIALTQIPNYLRLIRGEIFRIREMEYADAARVVGNRPGASCSSTCCPTFPRSSCRPLSRWATPSHHGGALLHRPRHSAAAEPMGFDERRGAQFWTGEWWLFVPSLVIVLMCCPST